MPKQIYIDIPFELKFDEHAILTDTVYDSLGFIKEINKIEVSLKDIGDYRLTGTACMASTGGRAEISTKLSLIDSFIDCTLDFPGCSSGEWDTINSFAPNCSFSEYKFHLLKLEPYDEIPESSSSYIVKYVFKRKK